MVLLVQNHSRKASPNWIWGLCWVKWFDCSKTLHYWLMLQEAKDCHCYGQHYWKWTHFKVFQLKARINQGRIEKIFVQWCDEIQESDFHFGRNGICSIQRILAIKVAFDVKSKKRLKRLIPKSDIIFRLQKISRWFHLQRINLKLGRKAGHQRFTCCLFTITITGTFLAIY